MVGAICVCQFLLLTKNPKLRKTKTCLAVVVRWNWPWAVAEPDRIPAWIKTDYLSNLQQEFDCEAGLLHRAAFRCLYAVLSQHHALGFVVFLGCASGMAEHTFLTKAL